MKYPEADCVIGHSFGTSTDLKSVNNHLASLMLDVYEGRPMIADRTLIDAMPDGEKIVAHIVEGDVTNIKGQGVGTWGTLVEARQFMEENGLKNPLMVAQAYHVGRVVRQASKLGISSVLPEYLPKDFDKYSDQFWTRSLLLWLPFNAIATVVLKSRGQI